MAGAGLAWKVLGGGAAVLGGIAARKLTVTTWKLVTGKEPPGNPEAPGTSWPEALGWAVLSGAVVAVARLIATKEAAEYWQKSTGKLPPKMQDVAV